MRWMALSIWRASKQPGTYRQRDAVLVSQGLPVLRFDDLQVLKEIEGVMEVILRAISESLERNPPNPPFRKGGERIVAPLPRPVLERSEGMTIKTSLTYD